MIAIEAFYTAAAHAGLLVDALVDGQRIAVEFRAPDESVLDGLALSTDYTMRYPRSLVPRLDAGDTVQISGAAYRVREIRALGDGSECQATLSRL